MYMIEERADILSMTMSELVEWTVELGYPAFRAKQLFQWMYKGATLDEMNNLPSDFRK